jgi:SAM-dependent methyltransferase
MHYQSKHFLTYVRDTFPEYFNGKKILDVGAGDINGNNRELFTNCEYNGNDVMQAPNVTIVSRTKDLTFSDNTFDTIISSECFEHDPDFSLSIQKIYKMLKPGGLFAFTCATDGRPEHGTTRTTSNDSYGTIANIPEMISYYKNINLTDLNDAISISKSFYIFNTFTNEKSCDFYFFGFKNTDGSRITIFEKYTTNYVVQTTHLVDSSGLQSFNSVFNTYNTDKNSFFHNYSRQYSDLLSKFRDKPIKILEIGVNNGDSIKIWKALFKNYTTILGIDINPNCIQYANVNENIFVEIGNSTSVDLFDKVKATYGSFDIIIDDGSHINTDVIKNFELYLNILNDDGIYIVEDTICAVLNDYQNKEAPDHLNYFAQYIPYLNQCRKFSSTWCNNPLDLCVDPFKILKKTNNVFEYSIDKIEFGCSYVAIHKKLRYHWIP